MTICKRSYGFSGTFFEFATNIADARASIFGEFEHVKQSALTSITTFGWVLVQ